MQIIEVFSPPQIISVQELAYEIWNEYYPPIIGQEQVDYMLTSFQSSKSILQKINEGYLYFLLKQDAKEIGYLAIQKQGSALFISKFYIHKDARRQGYARQALSFLKDYAKEEGLNRILLTVNINNQTAIRTYEDLGFIKTGELLQDIGEGFKMDDYTYELQC